MKTKHINRLYYLLTENIRMDISIKESKENSLECLAIVNDCKRKKEQRQSKKSYIKNMIKVFI